MEIFKDTVLLENKLFLLDNNCSKITMLDSTAKIDNNNPKQHSISNDKNNKFGNPQGGSVLHTTFSTSGNNNLLFSNNDNDLNGDNYGDNKPCQNNNNGFGFACTGYDEDFEFDEDDIKDLDVIYKQHQDSLNKK